MADALWCMDVTFSNGSSLQWCWIRKCLTTSIGLSLSFNSVIANRFDIHIVARCYLAGECKCRVVSENCELHCRHRVANVISDQLVVYANRLKCKVCIYVLQQYTIVNRDNAYIKWIIGGSLQL